MHSLFFFIICCSLWSLHEDLTKPLGTLSPVGVVFGHFRFRLWLLHVILALLRWLTDVCHREMRFFLCLHLTTLQSSILPSFLQLRRAEFLDLHFGLFCEHQIRIWITTRMKERAAALAEGLPAPALCSSGDVRDLNIEYFKYAHQHRITEGQNKVVITYRMWARLMSSTNQPSFTIAKTISEEKREEEANGHVPKFFINSLPVTTCLACSGKTLNKFSCIALAGVSTEYLIYGFSEGGLDDIRKLDLLLKGLGFTQKKADSHVRWPLLNTVLVLWRHEAARGKVAEALSMGKSIGSCIDIIENSINVSDLLLKL
ncbi:ATP-dependent 6-phosphofructokinase 7 [Glycine soja]